MRVHTENWNSPVAPSQLPTYAVRLFRIIQPPANLSWLPWKHERALRDHQSKPDQKNCSANPQNHKLDKMIIFSCSSVKQQKETFWLPATLTIFLITLFLLLLIILCPFVNSHINLFSSIYMLYMCKFHDYMNHSLQCSAFSL